MRTPVPMSINFVIDEQQIFIPPTYTILVFLEKRHRTVFSADKKMTMLYSVVFPMQV